MNIDANYTTDHDIMDSTNFRFSYHTGNIAAIISNAHVDQSSAQSNHTIGWEARKSIVSGHHR